MLYTILEWEFNRNNQQGTRQCSISFDQNHGQGYDWRISNPRPDKFKTSIFLHAVAAIQLTNIEIEFQGAKTSKSTLQSISCGVLDYEIPVLRNVTWYSIDSIGHIGFDRTLYGNPKNKKWWQESTKDRTRAVEAEVSNSME